MVGWSALCFFAASLTGVSPAGVERGIDTYGIKGRSVSGCHTGFEE